MLRVQVRVQKYYRVVGSRKFPSCAMSRVSVFAVSPGRSQIDTIYPKVKAWYGHSVRQSEPTLLSSRLYRTALMSASKYIAGV